MAKEKLIQAYNPRTDRFVLIDVKKNRILGNSKRRYSDVPIKRKAKKS